MTESAIRLDYTNLMSDVVGTDHGVTADELTAMESKVAAAHQSLLNLRKTGQQAWMDLPHVQGELVREIKALVAEKAGKFENFVLLGIGGSSLGPIAVQTALNHIYWNLLSKGKRKGLPRLFVLDNIDPELMKGVLDICPPKKTLYNVITKSGSTAETMSQFLLFKDLLKKRVGENFKDHIIVTTDKKKGCLRPIVEKEGYRSFVVPDGVGGRFSVLSSVGLVPAAFTGVDIEALLKGAAEMDKRCAVADLKNNPAYLLATLLYILDTKKGKNLHVMFPYAQSLKDMADWFRQLWAESLGKEKDRTGAKVHCGPTPIKALGATDQHSQVQLYMEGPLNKAFIFLDVDEYRANVKIPKEYADVAELGYLGGKKFSTLLQAEKRGTEIALTNNNRPNATITLPAVSAHTVGQLFCLLEMATAYAGELYNINAFDQPGVEGGKIATYAQMGRAGYEEQAREIKKALKARARRTI